MKKFVQGCGRFATGPAVVAAAFVMLACGGGGGTTTPPPPPPPTTSYTADVVCPNGDAKTATSTVSQSAARDAANALCPAGKVLTVTPADKSVVSLPTSIATTTDSTLDAGSLTTANVTLSSGQNAVAGTVTANGTKGFTFTPSVKLMYGQLYTFAANVKDGLGRALSVATTFTTSAVSCVAPQVPAADGQSCVDPVVTAWWPPTFVPMGTKVYLDAKTAPAGAVTNATYPGQTQSGLLPPECKIWTDDCWKESVKNGTIKFVETTAKDPNYPTRSLVFALYKTVSTSIFPGQMLYCSKIFFADDGSRWTSNLSVEDGCGTWELVYQTGNSIGAIVSQKNPTTGVGTCYQRNYSASVNGWRDDPVTCP